MTGDLGVTPADLGWAFLIAGTWIVALLIIFSCVDCEPPEHR